MNDLKSPWELAGIFVEEHLCYLLRGMPLAEEQGNAIQDLLSILILDKLDANSVLRYRAIVPPSTYFPPRKISSHDKGE